MKLMLASYSDQGVVVLEILHAQDALFGVALFVLIGTEKHGWCSIDLSFRVSFGHLSHLFAEIL